MKTLKLVLTILTYRLLCNTIQVDYYRKDAEPPYTFALGHMKPPLYGLKPIFKRCKNDHLMYISRLLLMISSDCELNPGPRTPKYPCQICSKACIWGQRAVACDNCDQWYHVNCLGMASQNYNYHAQTDVSWICCTCGLPNFSTALFESLIIDTSNVFDSLNMSTNTTGNTTRPGSPPHTSSPKREQKSKQESPQHSFHIVSLHL
jgi:hypothetical protein